MQLVNTDPKANWLYVRSLGRAFAGAIIFGLPLLMTMEMWWLGFYLDRAHLAQFLLVNFVVLVGLSHVSGFEETVGWYDDLLDAFVAFGVAALASAAALAVTGIIVPQMPASEIVGKIAIQAVPASFGAMLASKQLGESAGQERDRRSYAAQLFLMLAGALFLAFNLAPTEEMILISFRMSGLQAAALVLLSIGLLHALVYTVGFRGEQKPAALTSFVEAFFKFSLVGYAIVVLATLYILWTFGRTEDVSPPQIASMVAVLSFPGAVGAAIARLVV